MRIISGKFGGRSLRSLSDDGTRPAMARTREALFSMLEAREINWPECRVLDLYAGTGSLALECISRGAPYAVLVDKGREQAACLAANLALLGCEQNGTIAEQDVGRFLRKPPALPFNLVFIDPPYRKDCLNPCLAALGKNNWLAPGAFVVAEIEKDARPAVPENLTPVTERLFGQTLLRIWKNDENRLVSGNI